MDEPGTTVGNDQYSHIYDRLLLFDKSDRKLLFPSFFMSLAAGNDGAFLTARTAGNADPCPQIHKSFIEITGGIVGNDFLYEMGNFFFYFCR